MRLVILLLCAASLFAATGDVAAVRVIASTCTAGASCNGWVAEIDLTGLSTGGTYNFGLGTNNNPSTAKIVFTVTSSGYSNAGVLGTTTRTVYATHAIRQPYGSSMTADETAGTPLTVRVSLSDQIYSSDTVTANISAGFYTGSLAAASVSVTNNSTQPYSLARVIANWSWPGWSRIAGTTLTVRAVGFQRHAMNGLPLACMVFTATDAHSHTVTTTVTAPTIDAAMTYDYGKVSEYVATFDTSTLTQGDKITVNFAAYPWVGDATSVMDTSDGTYAQPTPLYAPQYYLLDKTGAFGTAGAHVATTGNDSNSCAVSEASYNPSSPPPACATINGAAVKMAALNNTSGHNDAAGTMYLDAGNYNWTGASGTVPNTTSNIWATVTPSDGVVKSAVVINGQSGGQSFGSSCTTGSTNCGTPIHLKGLTVNVASDPVSVFNGITYLWFEDVSLVMNGTAPIYQVTDVYLTGGQVPSTLAGNGLGPFGTTNTSFVLVRGVDVTGAHSAYPYTFLSNANKTIGVLNLTGYVNGQAGPQSILPIVAYNTMYRLNVASGASLGAANSSGAAAPIGIAIIQNIFECNSTSATLLGGVANDGSAQDPVNNVMLWHNVFVGGRVNLAYNDAGSTVRYRYGWSEVGDIRDQEALKSDTFPTANAARTGNWAELYNVGRRSVLNAEVSGGSPGFAATGTFQREFGGLWSYSPSVTAGATQPPISLTNTVAFPAYVSRAAFDGTNAGAGMGDYHLTATSPALNMIPAGYAVLPYDLDGVSRRNDGTGAAGAYEYAPPSSRKRVVVTQ